MATSIVESGPYRLRRVDSMNFCVERIGVVSKGKREGAEFIEKINYFPDLTSALKFFIRSIENDEAKDVLSLGVLMDSFEEKTNRVLASLEALAVRLEKHV